MTNDTLFRLTLARDLGKTLAELDAALGPGELDLWRAFYAGERTRQRRADRKRDVQNVVTVHAPPQGHEFWERVAIDMTKGAE